MSTEATPSAAIPNTRQTTGKMRVYVWRLLRLLGGSTLVPLSSIFPASGRGEYFIVNGFCSDFLQARSARLRLYLPNYRSVKHLCFNQKEPEEIVYLHFFLQSIIRNERKIRLSNHLHGHYSQAILFIDSLEMPGTNTVHSSIVTPCFTLISSNGKK